MLTGVGDPLAETDPAGFEDCGSEEPREGPLPPLVGATELELALLLVVVVLDDELLVASPPEDEQEVTASAAAAVRAK